MTLSPERSDAVADKNAEFTRTRVRLAVMRTGARLAPIPVASVSRRVTLPAPVPEVFALLLDDKRLAQATGISAHIEPQVTGEVWFEDGRVAGMITELLKNRHLAMYWHLEHEHWPDNHYSTATFMLKPEGQGTLLVFYQSEIPAQARDEVERWWDEHFWSRLPAAFART